MPTIMLVILLWIMVLGSGQQSVETFYEDGNTHERR
jgi:hypothetical protein